MRMPRLANPIQGSPERAWIAVGVLVVVVGIVVLAVSGGKHLTPGQSARTYIESVQGDTSEVEDAVKAAPVAIVLAIRSPSQTELHRLAQDTKTAYEEIDSVRPSFAHPDAAGALGQAQSELFSAATGLRDAMGSFATYAGHPNPAARVQSITAYRSAVAEWDHGTNAIWRIAGLRNAPTL